MTEKRLEFFSHFLISIGQNRHLKFTGLGFIKMRLKLFYSP